VASAPVADCGIISPNKPAVDRTRGTTLSDSLARRLRLSLGPSNDHLSRSRTTRPAVPRKVRSDSRLDNWFSGHSTSVLQSWNWTSAKCIAIAIWLFFLASGTELFGFQKSPPAPTSELPRKRPPSANGAAPFKGVAPAKGAAPSNGAAPSKGVQPQKGDSVFHTIELADGARLVGLMLGDNPSEIFFACRREWMRAEDPQYSKRAAAIASEERKAYEQLRDRLKPMVETDANAKHAFFLKQELERAQTWLDAEAHSESELVLLILPKRDVKRLQLPETSRQLELFNTAVWAWSKHLGEPEHATSIGLREELQKQGIGPDLIADTPDLGRRFQAIPQSDIEWTARMSLVEFSRDRAIEFQGIQGMSIRIEPGKEADVASLLQKALSQQTSSILGELLGEKPSRKDKQDERSQNPLTAGTAARWYDAPRSQLHDPEERYFRTTEVSTDLPTGNVNVRSAFVVKMPDGTWSAIWRTEIDENASQVRADSIQRLNDDPQIQSLKNLLGGLGLASDENLNRALQSGASTMHAQQEANYRFEKFRQRYLNQLDVPILRWDPN